MRNRMPIGWTDVLIGLFMCVLIGTYGMSAIQGARDVANKAKCASNLHQIGLAILLYENEYQHLFPRTVQDASGDPKPVWGTPYEADKKLGPTKDVDPFNGGKIVPAANDVTAAMFLLVRVEQLAPDVFVCPSTKLAPWDYGGSNHIFADWVNWQGNDGLARHLSYSMQNPYASNMAIANGFRLNLAEATFAVAADMNPGGDAVTKVTLQSNTKQMQAANSLNHGQQGQNVLYGDGHAEWMNHPFCGTQHDNIYTACGPEIVDRVRKTAVVLASPCVSTDSILLPTAHDIGFAGPPKPVPLTAAELAKLATDIQGTYAAPFRGDTIAVLTVDDKSLKCEIGPTTIQYHYEVVGAPDGVMVLNLTAPKTKTVAEVVLDGKNLSINMGGDFPLDFPWHRTDPKNPTTQPFGQ